MALHLNTGNLRPYSTLALVAERRPCALNSLFPELVAYNDACPRHLIREKAMPQDNCAEYQVEVEAALAELKAIQASSQPVAAAAGAVQTTPIQGGDMGSRFYESVGRMEAAKRRYRAAVRALSECQGRHSA